MNAQQNYRLLQEIDANRRFLLQAYRDNPDLLARADPGVKRLLDAARNDAPDAAAKPRVGQARGSKDAKSPVPGCGRRSIL